MENKEKGIPDHIDNSSIEECIDYFGADPDNGFTNKEAEKQREKFGKNKIEEESESWIKRLLKHFWGPIPWMLEVAVLLAAFVGRWEDFAVIFTMLLINGGVSYWHESKAENAITALKKKLSPTARVIRNGETKEVSSEFLVPGDIVVVKMGDVVPADIKLLKDQYLSIDESALTGALCYPYLF